VIEIGRLMIKTAGRDAGLKCVVVDILDDKFVLIDGETRKRKCNVMHLEPLNQVIKIKKNASHDDIKKEFETLGLKARETKPKAKTQKPAKKRKTSEQLKDQKEEKRKLRDVFKLKGKKESKKAEEKKEESLEAKAGLEEKKETGRAKEVKESEGSKKAPKRIIKKK